VRVDITSLNAEEALRRPGGRFIARTSGCQFAHGWAGTDVGKGLPLVSGPANGLAIKL
jgi:hypothetical protein